MKKILLSILICCISLFYVTAQNLELMKYDGTAIINDTLHLVSSDGGSTMEAYVFVKNNSSKTMDVLVKVYVKNLTSGSSASYCWGASCFDIATSPSTSHTSIEAADTAKEFHSDLVPNEQTGVSEIMYTFYNKNNADDSVSVTIHYELLTTGINNYSEVIESISSYPNPVQNNLNISYSIYNSSVANITIYDIVGKQIKKKEIFNTENKTHIDVSGFNPGIYIWSFELNGVPIKTQKFIKN